ncbi:hypothetical protein DFS34DRAFT_600853 [Phlyctochytrium arcticum]|nr:hypothetical protein DFS34DRAFT_600853 [Phlyctochytrium arcticum]
MATIRNGQVQLQAVVTELQALDTAKPEVTSVVNSTPIATQSQISPHFVSSTISSDISKAGGSTNTKLDKNAPTMNCKPGSSAWSSANLRRPQPPGAAKPTRVIVSSDTGSTIHCPVPVRPRRYFVNILASIERAAAGPEGGTQNKNAPTDLQGPLHSHLRNKNNYTPIPQINAGTSLPSLYLPAFEPFQVVVHMNGLANVEVR